MTNEEKILARLDELTEEVREAKRAVRPYVELKQELEPLIHSMVHETTARLSGLDKNVDLEEVGDMVGQSLASSGNITEALKTLNSIIEFKRDFEPYGKDMFHELALRLQTAFQGFEEENLQELLRQFIVNMGNISEMMKMLSSMMDMKRDVELLSGPIVDDVVERLEGFKQRGLFDDFQRMLDIGEQVSVKMKSVDLAKAKPITGIFGMMSALKRPEVQEGLGVLIELSTVASALKHMPKEEPTQDCSSNAA
ncbi:MAG: DUF1641 domain-containing protein [Candidatus Electrothrix sp. AX5]|jgi:uncharacterized protein YjgD (DUF1641 family)|uniref:DUF1641 domain-containing protein n=1 Tax=Candidatus Electrothrix aarhusensis TaxID=1859131 RepID=A0A3S3QHW9_9BACT|nr:DUF1641 domain-containing protein [Candidatus Electrothrix sp. AX5]RWX44928.1 hypothetical protein H206_01217 [Candidatus Electrothrix aarhusensis]